MSLRLKKNSKIIFILIEYIIFVPAKIMGTTVWEGQVQTKKTNRLQKQENLKSTLTFPQMQEVIGAISQALPLFHS